jgi:hypothetical protein
VRQERHRPFDPAHVPKPERILDGEIALYRALKTNGCNCAIAEDVYLTKLNPMGGELRAFRGCHSPWYRRSR